MFKLMAKSSINVDTTLTSGGTEKAKHGRSAVVLLSTTLMV